MKNNKPKVLAVSSGGGHWVQLLRLRPAFEGCDVLFATVKEGYRSDSGNARFKLISDANRQKKLALVICAWNVLCLVVREKPDIVISTGAAPGYFAVVFGKWLGARTIWVDSVANAEELSLSGRKAGNVVDLWLTQWQHLSAENGPYCFGSVL